MPPGVLDLQAHRGQEKLWMGFGVLVVELRGPCLLDVKMNQLISDDAGKSVKGTSAAPAVSSILMDVPHQAWQTASEKGSGAHGMEEESSMPFFFLLCLKQRAHP